MIVWCVTGWCDAGQETRRKRQAAVLEAAGDVRGEELVRIRAARADRAEKENSDPESVMLDWGDLLCDDLSVENETTSTPDLSG